MNSLMSSIDDIKEKLTDMEYKTLCDKMMDLHKQFKGNRIVEPVVEAFDDNVMENQIEEALDRTEAQEAEIQAKAHEYLSRYYVEDVEQKLQERQGLSSFNWVQMKQNQWMYNKLLPIRTQYEVDMIPVHVLRDEVRMDRLSDAYLQKELALIDEASAMLDELEQEFYQRFPDDEIEYRAYVNSHRYSDSNLDSDSDSDIDL
jgi:hypothetical protein